jgi:hypothetical protein
LSKQRPRALLVTRLYTCPSEQWEYARNIHFFVPVTIEQPFQSFPRRSDCVRTPLQQFAFRDSTMRPAQDFDVRRALCQIYRYLDLVTCRPPLTASEQ